MKTIEIIAKTLLSYIFIAVEKFWLEGIYLSITENTVPILNRIIIGLVCVLFASLVVCFYIELWNVMTWEDL